MEPAGQDLWAYSLPERATSTAPIAGKCQSFLDNVLAQFRDIRTRNYRSGTLRSSSCAVLGLHVAPRVMLIRLAIGATGPIRRRLPRDRHGISVTFSIRQCAGEDGGPQHSRGREPSPAVPSGA